MMSHNVGTLPNSFFWADVFHRFEYKYNNTTIITPCFGLPITIIQFSFDKVVENNKKSPNSVFIGIGLHVTKTLINYKKQFTIFFHFLNLEFWITKFQTTYRFIIFG